MIRIFKRNRPKHSTATPATSIHDVLILRWHGMTLAEWDALPVLAKVDCREEYYRARGMAS